MIKFIVFFSTVFLSLTAYAQMPEQEHPKEIEWHFNGPRGTFDRQSIQRGFQVYKEVCATCHSLNRIAYRNLQEVGFSDGEVKALAASVSVTDGPNDKGEMFQRPGLPSDHIVAPYANENAARAANNGAYPPDLSLIIKARHHGANYVYSLLTGFGKQPPSSMKMGVNMNYNPYFPGGQIAMPPPLTDGAVTFSDGTKNDVDQMARDVVNFLQWAAEPEMEQRKEMGLKVMMYLAVFTVAFYVAKVRIWKKLK